MAKTSRPGAATATTRLFQNLSEESLSLNEAPQAEKYHKKLWAQYIGSWISEILALSFSVSCAIAISVILRVYDGQPNPSFQSGVTLNALVSILATASKVSLIYAISNCLGQLKWVWFTHRSPRSLADAEVFDGASRGPLGSLILILTRPRRSLGILGALLTILAVAYDPFVQQILGSKTDLQREVVLNSNTVVPSARSFTVDADKNNTLATIYPAFWRGDFEWRPTCSSVGCTWPTVESLAWRSNCFEDRNWTLPEQCSFAINGSQASSLRKEEWQRVNCSLDSGSQLYNQLRLYRTDLWLSYLISNITEHDDGYDIESTISASHMTVRPIYNFFQDMDAGDWTSLPFMSISTFFMDPQPDLSIKLSTITCEIDVVLNEYEVKVTNGSLDVGVVNTRALQKTTRKQEYNLTRATGTETLNQMQIYLREIPTSNATLFNGLKAPDDVEPLPTINSPTENICGENCLQDRAFTKWSTTFSTYLSFQSNYTSNYRRTISSLEGSIFEETSLLRGFTDFESELNEMVFVWKQKGPQAIMENLAASMTKLTMDLSQNGNGTKTIPGYNLVPLTIVRVTWAWVILPFGVCILGAVFLGLTILVSHRANVPLWKSSANALLYHGIEDDYYCRKSLASIPEMNTEAEATKVNLTLARSKKRLMLEKQD